MQPALNVAEKKSDLASFKTNTERSSDAATKSSHLYILNMKKSSFASFARAFVRPPLILAKKK